MARYACGICGLHYTDKALAAKCHMWCAIHNSCRFDIARQSVEAVAQREGS